MQYTSETMSACGPAAKPVGYADRTPTYELLEKEISTNLDRVANLVARATRIADRVTGAGPKDNPDSPRPGLGGNGMLDVLRSAERVLSDHLTDLDVAISRMENDIG